MARLTKAQRAARKGWETRRAKAKARSEAARKGWETRRAKQRQQHESEAGDVAAISIVLYDARAPLILPLLEPYFRKHFPKPKDVYRAHGMWGEDEDDPYRLNIVFRKPLNPETVARRLEDIPWAILPTEGARMHVGFYMFDGEYLPATKAFDRPEEVGEMAIRRLLNGELTYEAPERAKSRYVRKERVRKAKLRDTAAGREKDNARRRAHYQKNKAQGAKQRREYERARKKR